MGDGGRIRREHLAVGAIYGTVVYVTILVLLEEDRTDPEDAVAILVGTALVFWLAHVYAHLVPQIAAEGRLRTGRFMETAGDQVSSTRSPREQRGSTLQNARRESKPQPASP